MGVNESIAKSGTGNPAFETPLEVSLFPSLVNWGRKRFAWLVDDFCFAWINYLHRRRPLPVDYATTIDRYMERWATTTVEDYYKVDEAALETALAKFNSFEEGKGRVVFPSPLNSGLEHNDHAVLDLYPCAEGWTAPTMILAHGLMSVNDRGYRYWAGELNKRGWNAIFVHLPFHYGRRSPGYYSGELAVGADIIRSVEGVRQAVQELRVALHWLKSKGCPLIGAWGTSYGGWISGILGCVDSRLDRLLLLEPVLNIQHAIWESHGTSALRAGLHARSVRQETVESHMRLCCPSLMELKVAPRHVILVAGEYDRITPVSEVEKLHKAWLGSHFHISKQGHVGHKMMPKSLQMAEELWPDDFCPVAR